MLKAAGYIAMWVGGILIVEIVGSAYRHRVFKQQIEILRKCREERYPRTEKTVN